MYRLQIDWQKQGQWENTVWLPMELMKVLDLMAYYNREYSHEHAYRIIKEEAN
jgi:hypothetical protein